MAVTFKLLRRYVNSAELQRYVLMIDVHNKKGEIVSKDYFLGNDLFISGDQIFIYQLSETTLLINSRVDMNRSNREIISLEGKNEAIFIGNDDGFEYVTGELFELYYNVFVNNIYSHVGDLNPDDYDDYDDYACDWWDYVSHHYNYEVVDSEIIRIDIPDIDGFDNVTKVIFN